MEENILDNLDTSPVDTSNVSLLEDDPVTEFEIPNATLRNKAATVSLLGTDPNKAVEQYQTMMSEGGQGRTDLLAQTEKQIVADNQERDLKAVMGVLADPGIDFNTKQSVVRSVKTPRSVSEILMTRGLSADSKDETVEAADARINLSNNLVEVDRAIKAEQGIVNAFTAGNDWKTASTISDFLASVVVPGATAKTIGGTLAELTPERTGFWQTIKPYMVPGSATKEFADEFAKLSAEERVARLKPLVAAIKKESGFILDDNALNQLSLFNSLRGDYSTFEKYLDNGANIFDIIGLGSLATAVRSSFRSAKLATTATKTAGTIADAEKAATGGFEPVLRQRTDQELASNIFGQQSAMIDKLETEKAGLLGPAGEQLDRGVVTKIRSELDVLQQSVRPADPASVKTLAKDIQASEGLSYKEATAKAKRELEVGNSTANAQINRLQGELDKNTKASTAMQRIAAIEKEVEVLKANRIDAPGALTAIADAVKRIEYRSLTHTYHPSSPAAIIQQSNPAQARALFHAVYNSEGDEAAQALYGTSRIEAIAGDVLPQITTESGIILHKPVDIQRNLRNDLNIPEEILKESEMSGAIQYTSNEKAKAVSNIVNDFESATTLKLITSSVRPDGGIVRYSGIYGAPEGSFTDAEQALKQAAYAWKERGVLPEELTVMSRQANTYVPVKLEDVKGVDGDYLIRVDARSDINPKDVTQWDVTTVKNNLLDSFGGLTMWDNRGSLSRWIFDIPSMLAEVYSRSFVVAKDQAVNFEKVMLNLASRFSDTFNGLDVVDKARVNDYIVRANTEQLKFDAVELMAEGMSQAAIDSVAHWRKFWDTHYHFENLDVVRTLDAQGFMVFEGAETTLFAKPVGKRTNSIGAAFDPLTNSVIRLTDDTERELYEKGGYYAKLRRPSQFDGVTTEYMVVRNTPEEYLRKVRETDRVLNYRDGYYQVQYKAPRFIDEITPDGIRRAVAVAGDSEEANFLADRFRKNNPDNKYIPRPDDRIMRSGTDDWFDINSAGGRIAQRHRGKLLESSNASNIFAESAYVVQPIDSAIHAARSIGGRTVMRPVLEAAKARYMAKHGDLLTGDNMGFKSFPTRLSDIGTKGGRFSKEVTDARTEFEAISYMEKGYINSMDNIYKATLNKSSEWFGNRKWTKAEKAALAAAQINPTGDIKGAVFMATVASSFHRQWIVQFHQAIRAVSYNPKGFMNGGVFSLMGEFTSDVLNGTRKSDFTKWMDRTGVLSAVDKQIMVKGTLLEAADNSNRLYKPLSEAGNFVRKVGYDAAEQGNLIAHGAAVYERWKRKGSDLNDKTVGDLAASELRALTGDMNYAGDMVYNQTSPAILMQFFLAPHKTGLMVFNRRLDAGTKARILLGDMLLWGAPTRLISDVVGGDMLPENPMAREALVYGLETMVLNEVLRIMLDDKDVNIDFTSLAPYDFQGLTKLYMSMVTGGPVAVLAQSPAYQFFAKDQGKVQVALASLARFFSTNSGLYPIEDQEPHTAMAVVRDFGRIFSGVSNSMDAWVMVKTGQVVDKHGNVVDPKTNHMEAAAKFFGFQLRSEADYWYVSQQLSGKHKDLKEEVDKTIDISARLIYNSTGDQMETYKQVINLALSKYENNPIAMEYVSAAIERTITSNKYPGLIGRMFDSVGIKDNSSLKDLMRQTPGMTEEERQKAVQVIGDFENSYKGNK